MILHVAFHIIFLSIVHIIFHSVGSSCGLLWYLVVYFSPCICKMQAYFHMNFALLPPSLFATRDWHLHYSLGVNTFRHTMQSQGISVCPHWRNIGTARSHPLHCDCRRHRNAKSQSQTAHSRHSCTHRADRQWGRSDANEAEWTVGRDQERVLMSRGWAGGSREVSFPWPWDGWRLPLLVILLYEYVNLLTLVKRAHMWSWGKVSFVSLSEKGWAGMGPTRPTSIGECGNKVW